jgi:hypothetical protein
VIRFQRAAALVIGLALCVLVTQSAGAQPSALLLEPIAMLGANTPGGDGWFTIGVRITNSSDAQIEGNLELTSELPYGSDQIRVITRAPFGVAGKGRVTVQLPTHGFAQAPPVLRLRALDGGGKEISAVDVPEPRMPEPLLFDLSVPSRILPNVRGLRVAVERAPGAPGRGAWSGGGYGAPTLAVSMPQINPATGDPVLPEQSAGYAPASVVLARSAQLAKLQAAELHALGSWVLSGGALAVVITRPEDLRMPVLVTMLGGTPAQIEAPESLRKARDFWIAPDPTASPYPAPYPGAPSTSYRKSSKPGDEITLVSFVGGNLRPSPWGATASYGLGELHLLAFDDSNEKAVGDEWVQLSVVDLVRHAWQRAGTVVFSHGKTPLDGGDLDGVRKQLDPNEGARWAIAVAALLLLLYAVLAGPVNFHLAARRGRPLRALIHLPIWAGAFLLLIVLLGTLSKGIVGRARHLTLVEAGAGMPRAAATRFRGFYSSSAGELVVRGSERDSVLDVAGAQDDTTRVLVLDRDGARLESFKAKPWETVVVREDGFIDLGGGISLVEVGSELDLKNRTARDLLAVVVRRPGGDAFYFPRIADGQSVRASTGQRLPRLGKLMIGSGLPMSGLDVSVFGKLADADAKGSAAAWRALDTLVAGGSDWWPDDVPVLIAQLEGGEGKASDSGLRIDIDRVLVRVVGWGGVP